MRDEGDMQGPTLTQRVRRLEDILVQTGIAGDRNEYAEAEAAGQQRIPLGKIEQHRERATAVPKDPTALEDITNRITSGTERLHDVASNLEQIACRILGPLPEMGEEQGAVRANPEGTLDHTYLALNYLDSALGRLHNAALRMERI